MNDPNWRLGPRLHDSGPSPSSFGSHVFPPGAVPESRPMTLFGIQSKRPIGQGFTPANARRAGTSER